MLCQPSWPHLLPSGTDLAWHLKPVPMESTFPSTLGFIFHMTATLRPDPMMFGYQAGAIKGQGASQELGLSRADAGTLTMVDMGHTSGMQCNLHYTQPRSPIQPGLLTGEGSQGACIMQGQPGRNPLRTPLLSSFPIFFPSQNNTIEVLGLFFQVGDLRLLMQLTYLTLIMPLSPCTPSP